MKFLYSLKYRIAITIFLLETILLFFVLTETHDFYFESTKSQIEAQDENLLSTLSEASLDALLITDYSSLQTLFQKVAENNHIKTITLSDSREIIIASSNPSLFGQKNAPKTLKSEYIKNIDLEDFNGFLGELQIIFSNKELTEAKSFSLERGITIAFTGMVIIALFGVLVGYLLTRRLNKVIEHTRGLGNKDFNHHLDVKGKDEISELAQSLNQMQDKLSSSFKHVEHLAYHDSLTGLVNRVEFSLRLSTAIDNVYSRGGQHALMLLDLDQFKIINDTSGHEAGDKLLIAIAEELLKTLRLRDTLARLGGDEFGILLEYCPLVEALQIAEKVRNVIEEFEFNWKNRKYTIGVSIGLVAINENSESSENLMSLADIACYEAKDAGGNTIKIASNDDVDPLSRENDLRWITQLSDAIDSNQWVLHFQKMACLLGNGKLYGEFLLRLKLNGELLAPAKFIQAAERYQLMTKIDCHTVEKIFKHLIELKPDERPQISFINLSGQTIGSHVFLNKITHLLKIYELDPKKICLEITETVAVNNEKNAIEFINKLKALGFKFALDDFGCGMAGFNQLKTMPVDIIKIDGQFVVDMLKNKIDHKIVSSINETAHIADMMTVAEFVEDQQTLDELKRLKVDFAQGYHLHKPEDATQVLNI